MSMDLEVDCPHCAANIGEICADNCEVNGKKLQTLKSSLSILDLSMDSLIIPKPKKEK